MIDEPGLLVLVGVTYDDTPEQAAKLAAKLWGLRILDGEKSCSDVAAPLLVISQFTLYADLTKGRRPSWSAAAPGPVAQPLVDAVVQALRDLGARVETGVFGARDAGVPDQRRPRHHRHGPVAVGPSPASTHCGRARSEIWSCDRNAERQNDRAADPQ